MNRPSSSIELPRALVNLAALILVGLVSIAVALVLGEMALRLSSFSFPNFYLPDDLTGSRLRPNMSGWTRREGEAFVRISSRAALQDLRLYQLMRKLRAGEVRLRHNTPIAVAIAKGEHAASPMTEPGLDKNVLREPQDAVWEEAWTITEKLLLLVAEETRRGGARFVLTTLSNSGSVHPDEGLRKAYAAHLGVPDLFYPDRRIRSFAERHGIEVVTLGPQMQRLADATRTYFHAFPNTMLGFAHWNHAGHEVAGKLIAQQLCERRS
jgi:hypothetical protein